MQRLAHGAEHRFQPRRLGRGNAERGRGLFRIEAEQMRAGRGRPEAADRAGGMEAASVVIRQHQGSDPAFGLIAGDESGKEIGAARARIFGERQQRRHDRDGRVAAHGHVDVVVVERMGRGAVHQGRLLRRDLSVAADQARGRPAAVLERLVGQDAGERLARTGEGDREPIQQALARQRAHLVRQVLVADRASPLGKLGGDRRVADDGSNGRGRWHDFLPFFLNLACAFCRRPVPRIREASERPRSQCAWSIGC